MNTPPVRMSPPPVVFVVRTALSNLLTTRVCPYPSGERCGPLCAWGRQLAAKPFEREEVRIERATDQRELSEPRLEPEGARIPAPPINHGWAKQDDNARHCRYDGTKVGEHRPEYGDDWPKCRGSWRRADSSQKKTSSSRHQKDSDWKRLVWYVLPWGSLRSLTRLAAVRPLSRGRSAVASRVRCEAPGSDCGSVAGCASPWCSCPEHRTYSRSVWSATSLLSLFGGGKSGQPGKRFRTRLAAVLPMRKRRQAAKRNNSFDVPFGQALQPLRARRCATAFAKHLEECLPKGPSTVTAPFGAQKLALESLWAPEL